MREYKIIKLDYDAELCVFFYSANHAILLHNVNKPRPKMPKLNPINVNSHGHPLSTAIQIHITPLNINTTINAIILPG
jgi:hypothetical protein